MLQVVSNHKSTFNVYLQNIPYNHYNTHNFICGDDLDVGDYNYH